MELLAAILNHLVIVPVRHSFGIDAGPARFPQLFQRQERRSPMADSIFTADYLR